MPFVDRGTHRVHYDVQGRDDAPPLLLVMGMGFSSRAWHDLAALIPGARLVELPGAGHVFPVERPRETIAALKAFFLRLDCA